MKFTWTQDYSVGIPLFDEQHKHFFELANSVYDLLELTSLDRAKIEAAVNDMANYALYHLSSEEDMFNKYNYPEVERHMAAHNQYRKDIRNLFERSRVANESEILTLTKQVVDFASDWLRTHIIAIDKEYTTYLQGKATD